MARRARRYVARASPKRSVRGRAHTLCRAQRIDRFATPSVHAQIARPLVACRQSFTSSQVCLYARLTLPFERCVRGSSAGRRRRRKHVSVTSRRIAQPRAEGNVCATCRAHCSDEALICPVCGGSVVSAAALAGRHGRAVLHATGATAGSAQPRGRRPRTRRGPPADPSVNLLPLPGAGDRAPVISVSIAVAANYGTGDRSVTSRRRRRMLARQQKQHGRWRHRPNLEQPNPAPRLRADGSLASPHSPQSSPPSGGEAGAPQERWSPHASASFDEQLAALGDRRPLQSYTSMHNVADFRDEDDPLLGEVAGAAAAARDALAHGGGGDGDGDGEGRGGVGQDAMMWTAEEAGEADQAAFPGPAMYPDGEPVEAFSLEVPPMEAKRRELSAAAREQVVRMLAAEAERERMREVEYLSAPVTSRDKLVVRFTKERAQFKRNLRYITEQNPDNVPSTSAAHGGDRLLEAQLRPPNLSESQWAAPDTRPQTPADSDPCMADAWRYNEAMGMGPSLTDGDEGVVMGVPPADLSGASDSKYDYAISAEPNGGTRGRGERRSGDQRRRPKTSASVQRAHGGGASGDRPHTAPSTSLVDAGGSLIDQYGSLGAVNAEDGAYDGAMDEGDRSGDDIMAMLEAEALQFTRTDRDNRGQADAGDAFEARAQSRVPDHLQQRVRAEHDRLRSRSVSERARSAPRGRKRRSVSDANQRRGRRSRRPASGLSSASASLPARPMSRPSTTRPTSRDGLATMSMFGARGQGSAPFHRRPRTAGTMGPSSTVDLDRSSWQVIQTYYDDMRDPLEPKPPVPTNVVPRAKSATPRRAKKQARRKIASRGGTVVKSQRGVLAPAWNSKKLDEADVAAMHIRGEYDGRAGGHFWGKASLELPPAKTPAALPRAKRGTAVRMQSLQYSKTMSNKAMPMGADELLDEDGHPSDYNAVDGDTSDSDNGDANAGKHDEGDAAASGEAQTQAIDVSVSGHNTGRDSPGPGTRVKGGASPLGRGMSFRDRLKKVAGHEEGSGGGSLARSFKRSATHALLGDRPWWFGYGRFRPEGGKQSSADDIMSDWLSRKSRKDWAQLAAAADGKTVHATDEKKTKSLAKSLKMMSSTGGNRGMPSSRRGVLYREAICVAKGRAKRPAQYLIVSCDAVAANLPEETREDRLKITHGDTEMAKRLGKAVTSKRLNGDGIEFRVYSQSTSGVRKFHITTAELLYFAGINPSAQWLRPWQVLESSRYMKRYWQRLFHPAQGRLTLLHGRPHFDRTLYRAGVSVIKEPPAGRSTASSAGGASPPGRRRSIGRRRPSVIGDRRSSVTAEGDDIKALETAKPPPKADARVLLVRVELVRVPMSAISSQHYLKAESFYDQRLDQDDEPAPRRRSRGGSIAGDEGDEDERHGGDSTMYSLRLSSARSMRNANNARAKADFDAMNKRDPHMRNYDVVFLITAHDPRRPNDVFTLSVFEKSLRRALKGPTRSMCIARGSKFVGQTIVEALRLRSSEGWPRGYKESDIKVQRAMVPTTLSAGGLTPETVGVGLGVSDAHHPTRRWFLTMEHIDVPDAASAVIDLQGLEAITSIVEDQVEVDDDSSDDEMEIEKEAAIAMGRLQRYNSEGSFARKSSMRQGSSTGHSVRFAPAIGAITETGDDDEELNDTPVEGDPLKSGSLKIRMCLKMRTVSKPINALLCCHFVWEPPIGVQGHVAPAINVTVTQPATGASGMLHLGEAETGRILCAVVSVSTPRVALLRVVRNRDDEADLLLMAIAGHLRILVKPAHLEVTLKQ